MGDAQQGRAQGDLAGVAYWNENWKRSAPPGLIDPSGSGRWNYPNRELERFLRSKLGSPPATKRRLLELGCARSIWLPYFANSLGYSVTGIDYSPEGCAQSRELLKAAGIEAEVVCSDFFAPPSGLLETFDVVFSYGVVEHFDDTASALADCARYLVPGGLLVTVVPNLTGVPGFLQRELNRDVFDKHVPLTAERLTTAYEKAGLVIEESGYLVSANPGVLNLEGLKKDGAWLAKKVFVATLSRLSLLGWYIDEHWVRLPASGAFAAYVQCVGRKRHPAHAKG